MHHRRSSLGWITVAVGWVTVVLAVAACDSTPAASTDPPPSDTVQSSSGPEQPPLAAVLAAAKRTTQAGPVRIRYDAVAHTTGIGDVHSHDVAVGTTDFSAERASLIDRHVELTDPPPLYVLILSDPESDYVALAKSNLANAPHSPWQYQSERSIGCDGFSFELSLSMLAMRYLDAAVTAKSLPSTGTPTGSRRYLVTIDPRKLIGHDDPTKPFSAIAAMGDRIQQSSHTDPRAAQMLVTIDNQGRVSQIQNTAKLCYPDNSYSDTLTVTEWNAPPVPHTPPDYHAS
jgi:hypothetical protein